MFGLFFVPLCCMQNRLLLCYRNPELSYKEFATSAYIVSKLRECDFPSCCPSQMLSGCLVCLRRYGIECASGMATTGVVGLIVGTAGPGPCIALRCVYACVCGFPCSQHVLARVCVCVCVCVSLSPSELTWMPCLSWKPQDVSDSCNCHYILSFPLDSSTSHVSNRCPP